VLGVRLPRGQASNLERYGGDHDVVAVVAGCRLKGPPHVTSTRRGRPLRDQTVVGSASFGWLLTETTRYWCVPPARASYRSPAYRYREETGGAFVN
jgi:hypothetical protein